MKLYVMCVTPRNLIAVDRRVLNQCEIFHEQGWEVFLVIPHNIAQIERYSNFTIIEFDGTKHRNFDEWVIQYFQINKNLIEKPYTIELTKDLYPKNDQAIQKNLEIASKQRLNISNRYLYTNIFLEILRKDQPDAVYCADYHSMIAARVFYDECKTPYIIDSHEYCLSHQNYNESDQILVKQIELQCMKYASAFVTVSSIFADLYQIEYQLSQIPFVYYNAPKPVQDVFNINVRSHFKIPSEHKIILFHGGLPLIKRNLDLLLRISPNLKNRNIHLLFVGYGPLVEEIKKYEYVQTVHYLNTLPQDQLSHLIKQVDSIIVPYIAMDINQKFCAPNRFFDALSNRIFIIANHSLEIIKGVIDKFNVGYYGPMNDEDSMTKTILDAFEYKENTQTYQNTELIDDVFGFESQKQVIITLSHKLKSAFQYKKQKDLKLYEFKSLLEKQILINIENQNYDLAKEYCSRLKLLYPFDQDVLELEELLNQ